MMNRIFILFFAVAMFGFVACEQSPETTASEDTEQILEPSEAEQEGQNLEESVEDAGQEVEGAAEDAGQEVEEATEPAEEEVAE